MSFQPNPGDAIVINQIKYVVDQHPAAPGMAYAQAGRQGTVYKLMPESGDIQGAKALKIFYPKYRNPALVYQSEKMEVFSTLPGLKVCRREVITPERNGELIAQYPDMLYAVLMPWVNGSTWMDVLAHGDLLTAKESWELAKGLAAVGSGMEQKGLAHCDLSSPNVLLPRLRRGSDQEEGSAVELVDVEQLYSARLDPPDIYFAGSPGYASGLPVHRSTGGPWHAYADRFAGAIILAEMLSWSDPQIVSNAWGESYFDPDEMQTPSERYTLMTESLESRWGKGAAELFTRAWQSDDVRSCPTFGEWLVVISGMTPQELDETPILAEQAGPPAYEEQPLVLDHRPSEVPDDLTLPELIEWSRNQEMNGNTVLARQGYQQALADSSASEEVHIELTAALSQIAAAQEPASPKQQEAAVPVSTPKNRRWYYAYAAGAALLLILAGIVVTRPWAGSGTGDGVTNQAEQSVKRPVPAAPAAKPSGDQVAKPNADAEKIAEAARAEAAAKAAKLEEERKAQEKKKQEEAAKQKAQQAAAQKAQQEKFDRQLQYEKYLIWKKDRDERLAKEAAQAKAEAAAQAKTEAARKAKLEQQKRENAKKAQALQAKRDQQSVKLNASFNQAYNAWKGGKDELARAYAWQFFDIYNNDSAYFGKNAKLAKRASGLKKYLAKSSAGIPDI
ncbi:protein kinase family protein [Paenibacillus tuaregi]|uniref:hypothetical protein n=1 Tax=Paenibacillus tuaregi TaxID=1816681 RepID=UPI0008388363|nr:hypothetical protein [Paenibacillus tuaregi]